MIAIAEAREAAEARTIKQDQAWRALVSAVARGEADVKVLAKLSPHELDRLERDVARIHQLDNLREQARTIPGLERAAIAARERLAHAEAERKRVVAEAEAQVAAATAGHVEAGIALTSAQTALATLRREYPELGGRLGELEGPLASQARAALAAAQAELHEARTPIPERVERLEGAIARAEVRVSPALHPDRRRREIEGATSKLRAILSRLQAATLESEQARAAELVRQAEARLAAIAEERAALLAQLLGA